MSAEINPVVSPDVLDALFEDSYRGPVVLFKHSSSCGISAHMLEEITAVEAAIHVVVVQKQREISNAIERRTGYRHQSPQAFVIKDGKAIYHASHYGIDVDTISRLLQE